MTVLDGLCKDCGKLPRLPGFVRCAYCHAANREQKRVMRSKLEHHPTTQGPDYRMTTAAANESRIRGGARRRQRALLARMQRSA